MEPREQVQTHASQNTVRPKTKVREVRQTCREKVKDHSHWLGHVDPLNIVICSSVVAVPVLGATIVLLLFIVVAVVLLIILW